MTVITHMAVGAAVGSVVDSRTAAFALGLLSHVPLDILPHYEFEKLWVEAVVATGVVAVLTWAGLLGAPIFWGIVGAAVPDFENFLWRLGYIPGERKIFPGHNPRLRGVLAHGRALGHRHALTQVAIVSAAIVVVLVSTSGVR